MRTDFDGIKAIKEEIIGLGDIITVLTATERRAQQKMVEGEAEFNAATKLRAFAMQELERKRKILRSLEP